jgi:hypothetical protein
MWREKSFQLSAFSCQLKAKRDEPIGILLEGFTCQPKADREGAES